MPTQIGFNSAVGEVYYINPVTEKEVNIFQTEYINKDAIEEFIKQYNSDYSMSRIKSNMEADDRITGDEVDYIIEQMEIWEEDQEAAKGADVDNDFLWTGEAIVIKEGDTLPEETIKALNSTPVEKKERKKRESKTTSPVEKSSGKKLSAEDYIALLKEKIELTELITVVMARSQTVDIPETMSKKSKDLIFCMDKEISMVIDKYLELVQNL